ncbi:L-lactate dehydrogenase [Arthrobacter stackebrandtii]|uniref:L-lactate dehydrogenase n=1 Tax=Arthrobacter stackebrandtii TaxID=272161 RepID=A0ABS4YUN5_9MICC|nr:L-lactate dehydrogenase [Arthrobacter stackebrandtii]MBP2412507.1 L-lactate dehydrogenase [Arthrobacter stackebrandtii]PYH02259.1 L-lactate dehydrogenase [Arthrobacter stackebrandtii]
MTIPRNTKLTVVGAGSVGTALAYAALIRGSAREVVLYDIATAKAEAEVLDLAHGTPFVGSSSITGGSDIGLTAGSDVVVITAGAKQEPGQTRLELAGVNVGIMSKMLPALIELSPHAVYILVTNPCDVLTAVAERITDLPPGRIFSSGTVLDSARLRWLVAEAAGVAPQSVHALIVGEHGDTEFPLWSAATIGQTPLPEWTDSSGALLFPRERLETLTHDVVHAAYKVIAGKGATNYAIGLSGARIVEAVLRDERAVLPVSSVLHGYRGIDGVALSVPSIVGAGGVQRVLDTPMDDREAEQLQHSAQTLADSIALFT